MSDNASSSSSAVAQDPQLRFHARHGQNIRINHDATVAQRINTSFFARGVLFSSRAVKPNEKIYFKLTEVAEDLGGFVYVGFTSRDPQNIPLTACKDLASKTGFWSWFFPKELCKQGALLSFHLTTDGRVRYGVDYHDKGSFDGRIRSIHPLWAFFDIFGNSRSIRWIDVISADGESGKAQSGSQEKLVPLILHNTHSRSIKINKNIAYRTDTKYTKGYIFGSAPLDFNRTVVFNVGPRDQGKFHGYLHLGVTSCDPGSLHQDDLPDNANLLVDRPEYWVLICDFNDLNCEDEISLVVNEDGQIHFRLNRGKFGGVAHVDVSLKLWVFLSVYGSVQPIQALVSPERAGDEDKDKDKECVVCYDNSIETALYRCGHTCMCFECAVEQWQGKGGGRCPLCRAVIKDVIRINR